MLWVGTFPKQEVSLHPPENLIPVQPMLRKMGGVLVLLFMEAWVDAGLEIYGSLIAVSVFILSA